MTQSPSVRPADRNGLEKVEKKSAIAVTSISSTRMRPTARSMPGSAAGAAHDARTSGDTLVRHVGQHRVPGHDHHHHVHDQRQAQAAVLAEDEFGAAERLGEQAVDAAPLHFLPHQPDADEHRDHQPEGGNGRQPQVLDDLDVLPRGELAHQIRRRHEQHGERHQVVEHLVADRLAEDADGHGGDGPGRAHPSPRSFLAAATWRTKKSSSVSRSGVSDTSCAPAAVSSPSSSLGRHRQRQVERVAVFAERHAPSRRVRTCARIRAPPA